MKKFCIDIFIVILLCFSVCMGGCTENHIDDSKQVDNENYVLYDSLDDFLSTEQIDLYIKAQKIYPLFKGHPDCIDTLHLLLANASGEEIRNYGAELSARREHNDIISGYPDSYEIDGKCYLLSMGEYQSLDSFKELCLSVFTDEYLNQLNCVDEIPQFIEINGRLYYNFVSMGGAFGYNPSEYPDKYEVTGIADNEICFNVIGHYKSSNIDSDYTVSTLSFPINLVLTSVGWRFALFNTAFS